MDDPIPKHWCNFVKFEDLPIACQTNLTHITSFSEPTSYKEASNDPNWVAAMRKEIEALHANETLDLCDLPTGKKAIGNKRIYKVKLNSDGTLERFKARLVIQGNQQKLGIDYY